MTDKTPAMKNKNEAVQDAAPEAAQDAAPEATKRGSAKKVRVRSLVGDMLHLYQEVWVTSVERVLVIDDFARAQIAAGKWEIVTD